MEITGAERKIDNISDSLTLKFNSMIEFDKVHVRAKFNHAKCSGS